MLAGLRRVALRHRAWAAGLRPFSALVTTTVIEEHDVDHRRGTVSTLAAAVEDDRRRVSTLVVRNLQFEATAADLREALKGCCCEVVSVRRSRGGLAYVSVRGGLSRAQSALDGLVLHRRRIRVAVVEEHEGRRLSSSCAALRRRLAECATFEAALAALDDDLVRAMSTIDLALVARRLAELHEGAPVKPLLPLLHLLGGRVAEDEICDGKTLAPALAALSILDARPPLLVAARRAARCRSWTTRDLTTAARAITLAMGNEQELEDAYARLADETLRRLPQQDPEALSRIAWAFSRQQGHMLLYDGIAAAFTEEALQSLSPRALCRLVGGFRRSGQEAPELFEAAGEAARVNMPSFVDVSSLVGVAWAFAGKSNGPLYEAIARQAKPRLASFTAHQLALTAWSFSKAGIGAPSLFSDLEHHAILKLRRNEFTAQSIANLAWGFATAQNATPELFEALAEAAQARVADFEPQSMATLSWAFAKSNFTPPVLFAALATTAKVDEFTPQALATTAWAYSSAEVSAPELFAEIARVVMVQIHLLNAQELATVAWAFAKQDFQQTDLFEALAEASLLEMDNFNAVDLAFAATALGSLLPDGDDDAIFVAMAQRAEHVLSENADEPTVAFATVALDLIRSKLNHRRRRRRRRSSNST